MSRVVEWRGNYAVVEEPEGARYLESDPEVLDGFIRAGIRHEIEDPSEWYMGMDSEDYGRELDFEPGGRLDRTVR